MAKSNLNKEAYALAQEWMRWLGSRRFYGPAPHQSILAMLMREPGKVSRGEPDAEVSMELNAFNMAVMDLEVGHFVPFVVVYCDFKPDGKPVKCLAADLGIDRSTFYDRADKSALHVLKTTRRLVRLHESMRAEVCGFV